MSVRPILSLRRWWVFILFFVFIIICTLALLTSNRVAIPHHHHNHHPHDDNDLQLQSSGSSRHSTISKIVQSGVFREDLIDIESPNFHQPLEHTHNEPIAAASAAVANNGNEETMIKIPYKTVHLDFKGAPPKLPFLKSLFKQIKIAGGNSILIEYEDMFPFTGRLANISHRNAFSEGEIKEIFKYAEDNELEIIPLVQTFGHLEFLLKLDGYQSFREVPAFPQEICPSFDKAVDIVFDMLDQVLNFHKKWAKVNYVHIGCDEVYHLAECHRCRETNSDSKDIFLSHVVKVAKHVKQKYKYVPIIWDDMMRKFYAEELTKSRIVVSSKYDILIGHWVDLMVWDYTEDVDHLVSPYLWPMYSSAFPNIWVASAFKGAFGESLYQVQIQRHAMNHFSWLKVVGRESKRIRNFRGIALTGWSRYDHFSVLCELLPVAVPSMILSLFVIQEQNMKGALKAFSHAMKCDVTHLSLLRPEDCEWKGKDLAMELVTLKFYQDSIEELIQNWGKNKGWLTDYNLRHNETSTWRLEEPRSQALQYSESLRAYGSSVRDTLGRYFEPYVINEWVDLRVNGLQLKLQEFLKGIDGLTKRRIWERRPLSTIVPSATI